MLFTSIGFVGFIIIVAFLYYIVPKKFQWILLLIASYVFYSFAGIKYLLYILLTTISTYLATRYINKLQEECNFSINDESKDLTREEKKLYKASYKKKQMKYMVLTLILNFGILGVLKYSNFVITNTNKIISVFNVNTSLKTFAFILPLGISFYTFQTMGYLIDVYRGKYKYEQNIFKLALFISFFPQLIQGPISRFDDLKESLFSGHSLDRNNVILGIQRIIWGYFKKLVIADRLLIGVNTIIQSPDKYQGVYVLLGMFFYAIELYADFTGGIDIAIGVGQVLGIKLEENFQRPYFSKSIVEYWRRWHITLGTWFRDYLFFPISVSKPMLKISKKYRKKLGDGIGKRIPVYTATIMVWLTTGIWHGAAWNFIVWGLGNCLVILVSHELEPVYKVFHQKFEVKDKFLYRLFQVARTFWIMSFLRTFDCYRDVLTTFKAYFSIIKVWNLNELFNGGLLRFGLSLADYTILTISVIIVLIVSLYQRKYNIREEINKKPIYLSYALFFTLFICIIIFGAYGVGFEQSQFIYSQF